MGRSLPRHRRSAAPAWLVPLALVALPNCSQEPTFVNPPTITPGTLLVRCDLRMAEAERECGGDLDLTGGVRLVAAAVALVQGAAPTLIGIDDSPDAESQCGGPPAGILFQGWFPAGTQVCIDPNQVGAGHQFPTSLDVCIHKCLDLMEADDANADALAFCKARATASTNVPDDPTLLFANGCDANGMPLASFADPRLVGQPIDWVNATGVDPSGHNLVRTSPCANSPCSGFDAGAASNDAVTKGDGYLEVTVDEQTTNRIIGLTLGKGADDSDVNYTGVGFGLDFFRDGCVYVFENGVPRSAATPLPECTNPDAAQGHYAPGDRFRISFADAQDGTAQIEYGKLAGPCIPGSECPALTFYVSGVAATYPFHVDAGFEDFNGALIDIRLTYIH
jgi:hypothetical protein